MGRFCVSSVNAQTIQSTHFYSSFTRKRTSQNAVARNRNIYITSLDMACFDGERR